MSEHHSPKHYIRIWAILLVLLIVSICGPMVGIKWLTLITAFGIAIVKATIVGSNFMHLNIEKRYVSYILLGMVILVSLFYFGTAPDVMQGAGNNWVKVE